VRNYSKKQKKKKQNEISRTNMMTKETTMRQKQRSRVGRIISGLPSYFSLIKDACGIKRNLF